MMPLHYMRHAQRLFARDMGSWPGSVQLLQLPGTIDAAVAQLAARRSHNPKVVSSILTCRIFEQTAQTVCTMQLAFLQPRCQAVSRRFVHIRATSNRE